jgi:glucosamine--fructose-6-phosphate aminotransferase (isomerizing)
MCGIVGYVGPGNATPFLLEGLKRLEYRGYDSAGVAVISGGVIERRRAAGKLRNLEAVLASEPVSGPVGIGHTRWATHGVPNEDNAHPHSDASASSSLVHNGIIENYLELKEALGAGPQVFETETDTEVVAAPDRRRSTTATLERAAAEGRGPWSRHLLGSFVMHSGRAATAGRRAPRAAACGWHRGRRALPGLRRSAAVLAPHAARRLRAGRETVTVVEAGRRPHRR